MDKNELISYIAESKIFTEWHWFQWHFACILRGYRQPFAESLINVSIHCDRVIPGFARQMIDNIASICGKEKFVPHYEQLIQRLAELHILHQLLTYNWSKPTTFKYEPTAGISKKNPEVTINLQNITIGVEVKAPALLTHRQMMRGNTTQLLSRAQSIENIRLSQPSQTLDDVILPRDNPVKDFFIK